VASAIASNSPLVLNSASAVGVPAGHVRTENGVTVRRFLKDVIRVGEFVKGTTGQAISVTPEALSHFATTYADYIANGNQVPVPRTHDTTGDPALNAGWVADMFVDGDRLMAAIDLIGDDSGALAASANVSIYAEPTFTDGNGKSYDWPIRHVALTTDPVITNLGPFVPIAASQGSKPAQVPVYQLSHTPTTEQPMPIDIKAIATKLGITAEVTDETFADAVAAHTAAQIEAATKPLAEKITAIEASHQKPAPPSKTLLKLAQDNRAMRLDALVTSAAITPAVRDSLAKTFIGNGNTDALALSLAQTEAGAPDVFEQVVECLKGNDPVKLGEQTKGQAIKLSNDGVDDKNKTNPLVADAEKRAAAIKTRK